MSYKSRSARRLASKGKKNFFVTFLIIGFLLFVTLQWILPSFIGGVGFIRNFINPQKNGTVISENASLAPPILNIPFESTGTAQIDIKGYGTEGSKVTIYLDDEKVDTVDVSADGTFEVKNVSLKLGTNNIYGKSIDEKNQESLPSKTTKIIFDNEKPPLNLFEPEDGKKVQGGDKKVKISGNTEVNAQVFVNDSKIIVNSEGNFSSEQSLNDGDNDFNIKAVDSASNTTEISRRVTYQP